MEIDIPVLANVNDERRTEGVIRVKEFMAQDRMGNSLKKLAFFWGIMILTVFIPVFHFVLVPLFFFIGLYMARRAYKSPGRVLSGSTICPNCQAKVSIGKGDLNWPLTEICQNCAREIRLEKK
ncbi:hypothetical protein D3C87_163860 [compost metagenome]